MIVVLVLCVIACFLVPLALVQWRAAAPATTRPDAEAALERTEVGLVSALLVGDMSRRDYHRAMARIAREAAQSGPVIVVNP